MEVGAYEVGVSVGVKVGAYEVGDAVGVKVGAYEVGVSVGVKVGAYEVGVSVGVEVGAYEVGVSVGVRVGGYEVGAGVGVKVGVKVGVYEVGVAVGVKVGAYTVGVVVGVKVGAYEVGVAVGAKVGAYEVGVAVGVKVGAYEVGVAVGAKVGAYEVGVAVDVGKGVAGLLGSEREFVPEDEDSEYSSSSGTSFILLASSRCASAFMRCVSSCPCTSFASSAVAFRFDTARGLLFSSASFSGLAIFSQPSPVLTPFTKLPHAAVTDACMVGCWMLELAWSELDVGGCSCFSTRVGGGWIGDCDGECEVEGGCGVRLSTPLMVSP